mmetsp:Transcript_28281/g.52174  ORF Transcript_28281/g.52174 Transcript_28281/m.52174 type:complete len:312 (+) Transcript_28281:509-1444(+)
MRRITAAAFEAGAGLGVATAVTSTLSLLAAASSLGLVACAPEIRTAAWPTVRGDEAPDAVVEHVAEFSRPKPLASTRPVHSEAEASSSVSSWRLNSKSKPGLSPFSNPGGNEGGRLGGKVFGRPDVPTGVKPGGSPGGKANKVPGLSSSELLLPSRVAAPVQVCSAISAARCMGCGDSPTLVVSAPPAPSSPSASTTVDTASAAATDPLFRRAPPRPRRRDGALSLSGEPRRLGSAPLEGLEVTALGTSSPWPGTTCAVFAACSLPAGFRRPRCAPALRSCTVIAKVPDPKERALGRNASGHTKLELGLLT